MTAENSVDLAVEVGRSMTARVIDRYDAAKGRRQATIAAVVRTSPLAAAGLPGAGASPLGTLLAEGDSWFDYPFHDVLKCLHDDYGYDIESVAHKGDCVEDIAYSDGQLDDFIRQLDKLHARGIQPRAILLSGGGNDIAGDEFASLLNHNASPLRGFNESVVMGVIDIRLADAYATWISSVSAASERIFGFPIRILVHGYDYAIPDGRGFLGGFWVLPGPWLEPGFRQKNYSDMSEKIALVRYLIDRFNKMLEGLVARDVFSHVRYVNLRGTLSSDATYEHDWANELHPTEGGFKKVTARFAPFL